MQQIFVCCLFLAPAACREDAPSSAPQARLRPAPSDTLWYKNTVIYTLDVAAFQDSDGDGRGDFNGLRRRLGYLDSLGVTTLWIAPFFESPGKDDGYDITDYRRVDPKLGTIEDFRSFMRAAKARRMRVITDLVINHTSSGHPWFAVARRDTASTYHDWYVWSRERPRNWNKGMVFPGVQEAIWTRDSVSGLYYYHRFYAFQPDLNAQHPAVQAEMRSILRYWISEGLDGFRLDGVPFLIEVPQTRGDAFPRQYEMLTGLRRYIDSLKPGSVVLGEANVLPDENRDYFGPRGERMQLMFNFYANQHLFLSLATGDARPLAKALEETRDIPEASQWAFFLRNHDEVDLGRLSRKERKQVYAAFGPEAGMQLYDRGIRRRLATMLGDVKRLRMAYGLLFSLPGTPVIRYGDEIGMGDNLRLPERLPVRTPMQWDGSPNAGFTKAARPYRPMVDSGAYGFREVNVAADLRDSGSLIRWTRCLIRLRRQCTELRAGSWEVLDPASDPVLAMHYRLGDTSMIILNNFSGDPQLVRVPVTDTRLYDLISGRSLQPDGAVLQLRLGGYESCWLRNRPLR